MAAAEPPEIVSTAVEGVSATGATLRASVNPKGTKTTYRFEYLTEARYEENIAAGREPFAGTAFHPSSGEKLVGSGTSPVTILPKEGLTGLAPDTAYRYRLRVVNEGGEVVFSGTRPFGTRAGSNAFALLDHRGWEMVSPIEKDGGAIQGPETIFGGGVYQAAAGGGAITYSSADSFGVGVQGAPGGSQYVSALSPGGWTTANITTPLLSGSYGDNPDGVPYQLFSSTLATGLLSNGKRCRGKTSGECPVANPPLPGSGAPPGYRDYYRRTPVGFEALLTAGDHTSLSASEFELLLVSANPELDHVIVSSCAALTANASEVAAPGGCDENAQNLYEWSGGALQLVNVLPGESTGTPGATIGAATGALSGDGGRIYFADGTGLYLREGNATKLVDESPPGPEFEVASADGGIAYLLDGGNLYRYLAASETLTPLTSGGEVDGVLGAAPDGSRVFYAEPAGLFMAEGVVSKKIAAGASALNWPPATGTARVSADGRYLLFVSTQELTGYPNEGSSEVFLYGPASASSPSLDCLSCNPTGERPLGGSSIPGGIKNGAGAGAFTGYKPRVLSADSSRVFFDSEDSLSLQDTDGLPDVYEWEAAGAGTCTTAGGCVQLISTGRGSGPSTFLDASADGSEAFFLTSESIYPPDPGSYDVYDARVGGGFVLSGLTIPCDGDACQVLPEGPEDLIPGTLVPNAGNPPLRIAGEAATKKKRRKHGKKKRRSTNKRGKSSHKKGAR